jgi:hypothetical protein
MCTMWYKLRELTLVIVYAATHKKVPTLYNFVLKNQFISVIFLSNGGYFEII